MMFAPRYTVFHCGYLKGGREMKATEYERQNTVLRAANAAQLEELHRISEALGTNEGHSSVTHIEILKGENAALRDALLHLSNVYDAMGGVCGTARIAAEEALLGKAHREKNGG